MRYINRFLPKHQGKRELVFLALLVGLIVIAGFIGGTTGVLYKDVPTSTPTEVVATPDAAIPPATPASSEPAA